MTKARAMPHALSLKYARRLLREPRRLLRYDYRLTSWLYLNRWRRLAALFERNYDFIRRATFVIAGAVAGLLIDRFGGASLTQPVLGSYLVAAGAMTGATIAIVFTISIFLLQNASDIYSSQYLEVYIHDWKEKTVYFTVILITIALFAGGLWVGSLGALKAATQSLLVITSLSLVATVFALIDWQYKLVRQKITPSSAIAFLEKQGFDFVQRLQLDARRMAGIMQADEGTLKPEIALAAAYNHFLQPFIALLDRQLENLVEMSIKLAYRHETVTARRGIAAVRRILEHFLEARRTSSLLVPSDILLLTNVSDSQPFLSRTCERLTGAAEGFIKQGQDDLVVYIMDTYGALAAKAKEISFIPERNENPAVTLFSGYLHVLIERAERDDKTELVFQGVRVLGNVAVTAAAGGLGATVLSMQDRIREAAAYGLRRKEIIVVDQCTSTLLRTIDAVFGSSIVERQHLLSGALDNIAGIAGDQAQLLASGYLPHTFSSTISLTRPYDELVSLLQDVVLRYAQQADPDRRAAYRNDLVEFFRDMNRSLRKLSENLRSCDTILVGSIGRLLFYADELIFSLIESDEFAAERGRLRDCLVWNIHLPSWFAHHAAAFNGSSPSFDTLTDCVAKTGILAATRLGDRQLVTECIESLGSITQHCVEKTTSKYGFDEPRVLRKACYLGIIGLRNRWRDVVTSIGLRIYEFEPAYVAKHLTSIPAGVDPENHNVMGLPHSNELVRELWRWREDFRRDCWNALRVREDAQTMMCDIIDVIDIDRFVFEVWGLRLVGTEFDAEARLTGARKNLLRMLRQVLDQKRRS